jgi:Zn-dependent peptidase ImmA (M78 family)
MENTYSPWGELAALPHIGLEWKVLAGRVGEYLHHERLIRLDPRMPRRQARSVLCHELRHAERAEVGVDCAKARRVQESRADRVAARVLVDVRVLGDALVLHAQHVSAAAVELRVSDKMVRTRLSALHPAERGYLRARLLD